MDLIIYNKWVSLRGSSVVKDLNNKDVCRVKGKFFTITRKKYIQTLEGETRYIVRNKFWKLFVRRAFVYDENKELVAKIRRKVFSFRGRYIIESKYGRMEIVGNILSFNYQITLNEKVVGSIQRNVSLRDSFQLHVEEGYDYLFFLAFVIAIDNITDEMQGSKD